MKISEVLKKAVEEVNAADVPAEYKVVAFQKAVEMLHQANASIEPASVRAEEDTVGNDDVLAKIAKKVGVDKELLYSIYDFDGALIIDSPLLPSSKMSATREIALLVCAARQGSGQEIATGQQVIREVAEEYGRYDSPNFMKALKGLGNTVRKDGEGRQAQYRLTHPGWNEVKQLIERFGATDE
jgi:hypothetical protein